MEQKYDIGLNAKINEFIKKYDIERTEQNDNDIFEDFGNYVITSNLLGEELDNIKSVSTNKAQGIDGIVIIVNDRLVTEESDLDKFGPTEKIKIKIGFIQSTTQNSFSEQKFSAFTDEVVKFLTGEIIIEPFSAIYKKLLDESGDFFDRIEETPRISLSFLSARTSHNLDNEKINVEKKKISERTELQYKCSIDGIYFFQKEEIKTEYEKISKFHTVQLKFENSIQLEPINNIEISLLSVIKFSELKNLILTREKNLKEKLFIENVRNYIGNTKVNIDIKNTLNNENAKCYFPFLNNGLVIICDDIQRHKLQRDTFILTFPRIINGCQTTNELFNQYAEINNVDDVKIVVKVIATRDNRLKKDIIYSANNQNAIDKDLQSLNEFHENIELFFMGKESKTFRLFFERLRGQHSNVTPPYRKINIETIARVFVSVFLQKPHDMKSKALIIIDKLQKEGKLFNNSRNKSEDYYYCGVLWYWFNYFLLNGRFSLKSKTMDMHVIMACDILLDIREGKNTVERKIEFLENVDNTEKIFIETVNLLNSKDYLFERRGFYSNPKTQKLIEELKEK